MQLQLGAFNLAPTVQLVRVAARLIRSASLLRGRVQNATSGLVLRWVLSMYRTRVPCAATARQLDRVRSHRPPHLRQHQDRQHQDLRSAQGLGRPLQTGLQQLSRSVLAHAISRAGPHRSAAQPSSGRCMSTHPCQIAPCTTGGQVISIPARLRARTVVIAPTARAGFTPRLPYRRLVILAERCKTSGFLPVSGCIGIQEQCSRAPARLS